jgi:2-iminobutanoate/2-iminopropanoate deaminase
MTRRAISTPAAPQAVGPYSQAIHAGSFLFVSGQIPIDPSNGQVVSGDVAAQTRRVMENIGEILKAAGSSFEQVVRTTVYLADIGDFPAMNAEYGKFFSTPAPARSTIQAARLPRDAKLEIDVIALVSN